VNGAEKSSIIFRLTLALYSGFVLLVVRQLLSEKRRMEDAEVIDDVELFLKAKRLQDLILPEQQTIIDNITSGWISEAYKGVERAKGKWPHRINTSSP